MLLIVLGVLLFIIILAVAYLFIIAVNLAVRPRWPPVLRQPMVAECWYQCCDLAL